jgi:O-antigen ligase
MIRWPTLRGCRRFDAIRWGATGAGLLLCLYAGTAAARALPALGRVLVEIEGAIGDPATQWLVALCLVAYLAVFTVLRRRFAREQLQAGNASEKWLFLVLLWAALRYGVDYSAQPLGTAFLMLLAGATMAQGVAAWLAWRVEEAGTAQRRLLAWLVLLLAAGACWHPGGGMQFEYRGGARWSGPWENPNQFGLLMGAGLVLAVGLSQCGRRKAEGGRVSRLGKARMENGEWKMEPRETPERRFAHSALLRFACLMFWLGLAGAFALGCLRSYSRGAWLGAALGLAYLVYQVFKLSGGQVAGVSGSQSAVVAESAGFWRWRFGAGLRWLVRERVAVVVLLVSLAVVGFWAASHGNWRLARRVASVGNVNDFSWRNRVAAWEGALVMIGDRPWFGWGWGVPEQVYPPLYLAERSEEGLAIQLNDYLMLGMSAGLPALVGLVGFVALALRERKRIPDAGCPIPDAGSESRGLSLIGCCRAGVVVLLVGFCFDGGLFKLPTATVFWVLLGLAQDEIRIPISESRSNAENRKPNVE